MAHKIREKFEFCKTFPTNNVTLLCFLQKYRRKKRKFSFHEAILTHINQKYNNESPSDKSESMYFNSILITQIHYVIFFSCSDTMFRLIN